MSSTKRLGPLFGVIALSLALNLTAVWWGLPSRYGWAPDELHPSVVLEGIDVRFSGDWHQPAYPPFHYYLLALFYLPVLALDLVEPQSISGHTMLFYLGRTISLAMGVGILVLVHRIGRVVFDEKTGLFSALGVALTAPFIYYSKTANLDVPLSFWVVLSLYFFLRLLEAESLRAHLLFTLAVVVAMLTKDQAFAFYVLPLGFYALCRLRLTRSFRATFLDRRVIMSLAVGTATFLALHNVVFNFQGFVNHFRDILWARGHYSTFEHTPSQQVALLGQTLLHLKFSLGWPLAVTCGLGVVLSLKAWRTNSRPLWILAFASSYYLFFVAPVLSSWLRYALPLAILLAPFTGHALAELVRGGVLGKVVAGVMLFYSLWYAASVDLLLLGDSRYGVERWLAQNVPEDAVVGYVGPEYYLPRLDAFEAKRLRPTESVLERESPAFLIVNRVYSERFAPGSREGELFSRLRAGRTGYGLALRHQSRPRGVLLHFEGVLANLDKLDPIIEVYQKLD